MIAVAEGTMNRTRPRSLVAAMLLLALFPFGRAAAQESDFAAKRERMVQTQIAARHVDDPRVLAAMAKVPRHAFVPPELRAQAYEDYPLPIGEDQTISQPYIVALMTSLLELKGGEHVLEIGTGSGYQAAVLAEIAGDVSTIEILEPLASRARRLLGELGYHNIDVRAGDGSGGWPEKAPFDGIVVTAAPPRVPQALLDQLKVGGRLVIPVGSFFQDLLVYTRTAAGFDKRNVIPVRFVPMTGDTKGDKLPR